jgi:uncharacterized protein
MASTLLDLNDLPDEGLHLRREVDPGDRGPGGEGAWLAAPALLVLRARAGERGVGLSGRIEAQVRVECSRCLEPCLAPVAVDFELAAVFEASEFGTVDQRMDPADADLLYAPGGRLDLADLVREQVLLALPLKPVCRVECAGLCPTCGSNRNRIECRCRVVQVDPRLAPLAAWREERGRAAETAGEDDDAESEA